VVPLRGDSGGDWRERTVSLKREVSGTHDLYLVAKGGRQVAALDWLTIESPASQE
jgi:hypothetical protein